MVSVHSLKLRGEGHRVSAGGPAQPGPVCSVPPGPLTCRLPGTLPGSPAPPGQRPGAAHNSSTLGDKAEGSVNFGATVLFRGGGSAMGPPESPCNDFSSPFLQTLVLWKQTLLCHVERRNTMEVKDVRWGVSSTGFESSSVTTWLCDPGQVASLF